MTGEVINKIRIELTEQKRRTSVSICRGDTISRIICITLLNCGSVYEIPDKAIATLSAVKPDGKTVYNDCVINGNEIQYTITNQLITVSGDVECQIKLTVGDLNITTPVFIIRVYEKLFDESILESSNDYTALQTYCARAEIAAENAEGILKDTKESIKVLATECRKTEDLVEKSVPVKEKTDSRIKIPAGYNVCMITNINGLTLQNGVPNHENPIDFVSLGEKAKIDIRFSKSEDFDTVLETYTIAPINGGLRSVGSYSDELCYMNHEMYIKRRVKTLTLTDQIVWTEIGSGTGSVHMYAYPVPDAIKNPSGIWFISNRFLPESENENRLIDIAIQSRPGYLVFTSEMEEQEFTEFWYDKELKVQYVLEEPQITEVLDENGIVRYTSEGTVYAEAYDQDIDKPITITMQIPNNTFGGAIMELL